MSIERVFVIGAGLMGHGIAQVSAAAGKQVTLSDRTAELAEKGKARIASNLKRQVDKGKLEQSAADDIPVGNLTWDEAEAFCRWLNLVGKGFVYREVPISYAFRTSGASFVRLGRSFGVALLDAGAVHPGPKATLGPAFEVDIARPRDRREMNHDARFKALRGEITQYLIDVAHRRQAGTSAKVIQLPSLVPRVEARKLPSLASLAGMRHAAQLEAMARQESGAAKTPEHAKSSDARFVEFSQVVKVYPTPRGPQTVVDGFDLKMRKGEFISVIGHSGCGKSTVLSMVAGLTDITEGGVILDGREIAGAGPDRGLVFQSPSLVPWLSAYDNVMLGVQRVFADASPAQRRSTVEYYLSRVGLADAMHKRAGELSNGMKQRVGIARALAMEPKVLLLDEPFGALDPGTRQRMHDIILQLWEEERMTVFMVTHDLKEGFKLGTRVLVFENLGAGSAWAEHLADPGGAGIDHHVGTQLVDLDADGDRLRRDRLAETVLAIEHREHGSHRHLRAGLDDAYDEARSQMVSTAKPRRASSRRSRRGGVEAGVAGEVMIEGATCFAQNSRHLCSRSRNPPEKWLNLSL